MIYLKKVPKKSEFTIKKKENHSKGLLKKAAQKNLLAQKITQKITKKRRDNFFLQDKIGITVGPWLMKLYFTPQSILTLVTWVPQSRLTFGPRQTESYSEQPRLPLAATIGPAGRSRVFFDRVRHAA